jgi:type I restriction enzyme S subunit
MSKEAKNTVEPERRFPEFTNTEKWNVEPLGEVYSFKSTNSFSRDDLNYENGEIKNIHYGDIHTKFSTLFDITKERVPFINPSVSIENIDEENFCREGDMIFADASEDLDDVGKSIEVINLNSEKLLSGMHTLLARQKESKLAVGFGGHLFTSAAIRKQIQRESQGTKVLGISATRISNIKVYYPTDKREQQKIASCLSSLDELITSQSQKLEALKEHKKGLMQTLFPSGGETVPKRRFKEFWEEWNETTLGQLGDVFMCKRIFAEETNDSGGIPFYKIGTLGKEPDAYISRELFDEYKAKYNFPRKGEVLITCSGTVGKCLVYDGEEAYYQDSNIVWIDNPSLEISNSLLYYLLSSVNWDILNSTTITRIYNSDLRALKIIFPKSKDEQQRIADCLISLDEIITKQSDKVEALKEQKKGLMQQLFPV